MSIFSHLVQGVEFVCWSDGSFSEYSVQVLSLDAERRDCSRLLSATIGAVGAGFVSFDGSFIGVGSCFIPRFGSNVQSWCCGSHVR